MTQHSTFLSFPPSLPSMRSLHRFLPRSFPPSLLPFPPLISRRPSVPILSVTPLFLFSFLLPSASLHHSLSLISYLLPSLFPFNPPFSPHLPASILPSVALALSPFVPPSLLPHFLLRSLSLPRPIQPPSFRLKSSLTFFIRSNLCG